MSKNLSYLNEGELNFFTAQESIKDGIKRTSVVLIYLGEEGLGGEVKLERDFRQTSKPYEGPVGLSNGFLRVFDPRLDGDEAATILESELEKYNVFGKSERPYKELWNARLDAAFKKTEVGVKGNLVLTYEGPDEGTFVRDPYWGLL